MQILQQISNRLFYLPSYQETDRPILVAVVGEEKTLLIDAGNSISHANLFKEQLAARDIYGDILALTHWHWDHVFGIEEMEMPTIANSMTYSKIKEMQKLSWEDPELDQRVAEGIEIPFCADAIKLELKDERHIVIPDPTLIYDKQMQLNLGGVTCTMEHIGGDHSEDSTLIYIQEEKALFLGDCLYANMYAEKWNYTVENMERLIQQIESYDAETFFLSHHPGPLDKKAFSAFLEHLKIVADLTKENKGNREAIRVALANRFGRALIEDDEEVIFYFVNGYK